MKIYNLALVGGGFLLSMAVLLSGGTYIVKTNFIQVALSASVAAAIVFSLFLIRLIKLRHLRKFHSITIASIDLILMVLAILALVLSAWINSPDNVILNNEVSGELQHQIFPLVTILGFLGSQFLLLVNVVIAMRNKRRKSTIEEVLV